MRKPQAKIIITLLKGFLFCLLTTHSFSNEDAVKLDSNIMRDRLSIIINKEYSIQRISDIEVGLVNYPQWFASIHLIRLNSLTFNNTVKGQEALYPTNITHDRWMYSFKTSNMSSIDKCRKVLKSWTKDRELKLTMSSQMMAICLVSLNNYRLDNISWYNKCWRYFNGRICK